MNSLLTTAAALVVAAALTACVILPLPVPATGASGEDLARRLRVGASTRADVHALLGAPNRLATARHDVWELEHDPFHLFVIIVGAPGGTGAGPIHFGEELIRYLVAVDYDAGGRITGWRWERPMRGGQHAAHGASEPAVPPPAEPERVLSWTAEGYAVAADGQRAVLLHIGPQAGKRLDVVELATGRRIAEGRDWPDACGRGSVSLGFDGSDVVSVTEAEPASRAGLCRWREEADGVLAATPVVASGLTEALEGVQDVRAIGRFV